MLIDSIEIFHVGLPLKKSLRTPGGDIDKLQTVLVRMTSGGLAGWGEASPGAGPWASEEWAAGVFNCIGDWLAPRLVGKMADSGDHLHERLARFRGNRFAKAALDTAWWDLHARMEEKPLHQLLGGKRDKIDIGVGFDQMESIDELLAAIGRATETGFSRIELKFRPGWDVEMVSAVRAEFPVEMLHIDVEGGLTLGHMEMLYRLEDFALDMIEQPLPSDDLVGHAMVQEGLKTPICLDESITTVEQADMALELKSCRYINIKPGRVGGLTPAVAIHDAAAAESVPCWVGAMPQSAIGTRIGLALAAKANFTYPADFFPAQELLADDLADPPQAARDEAAGKQKATLWSEPGIGVVPDPDRLEKFCIARVAVKS